jgi:Pentapeptide repeats (9 copies)
MCRFRNADLRSAGLGNVGEGRKRNRFQKVDFTEADLRQTANKSADFIECTFHDTKLTKVDFQGSVFKDCTFEGELREVQFHRTAFRSEDLPPNEMDGVDFSCARLWAVGFRNLDLNNVKWPHDDEHIIITDYARSLDRVIAALNARTDVTSSALAAYLSVSRRFVGPRQKCGIVNKAALIELCGPNAPAELQALLQAK